MMKDESLFFRSLTIKAYMIIVWRCHGCIWFCYRFLVLESLDFCVFLVSLITKLLRVICLFKIWFTQLWVLFLHLSVSFDFVITVFHDLFFNFVNEISHLIQEKSSVYTVISHRLRNKTIVIRYPKVQRFLKANI